MSLTASIFGRDSLIFKGANLGTFGLAGYFDKQMNPDAAPQRLGEISYQTAKEAEPRVIVWGRVRPIGGNLIHCQAPVKRMVKQKAEGGKGGSKKKTQKVERVYRTSAMGVCEGPITAFVRIWRNGALVYDARGNAWGAKNNPVFLKSFRLYTGAWTQMPDPSLEKVWGAGNVPAYRGTAYIVAIDEDLTNTQGAISQWQFEVERAEGSYLTSKPYRVVDQAVIGVSPGPISADIRGKQFGYGQEHMSVTPGVLAAGFGEPIRSKEHLAVTPGVLAAGFGEPLKSKEYLAVTPGVLAAEFSIPLKASPEYLAVAPGVLGAEIV